MVVVFREDPVNNHLGHIVTLIVAAIPYTFFISHLQETAKVVRAPDVHVNIPKVLLLTQARHWQTLKL